MTTENLWDAAKAVLRGKFITIHSRKTSKRQPNITPKITGKRRTTTTTTTKKKPKISRRKEIIKIRAEINEKEMKETMVKINKTKSWFFEKIKLTSLQPDSSRKREKNQINKNQK